MQPGIDFGAILASLLPMMLTFAVIYAIFAASLAVIARKTGTPGAGMAWIPIANMLLMCRIARKPGWWLLLFFIPLVNVIVGIVVWIGIARARGKSAGLVFLMMVPLVGLIVPLILAAGEPTNAGGAAPAQGTTGSDPQAAPRVCPSCGTPTEPGEAFCGECGQSLQRVLTDDQHAAAEPSGGAGAVLVAVLGLVAIGVAGWWFAGRGGGGADYDPPALPARAAGAVSEFPVDNDPIPAQPTSVIRQDLTAGPDTSVQAVPDDWLPPGLEQDRLTQVGDAVTSATYRTAPDSPPVPVHVIETSQGDRRAARRVARGVADAAGPNAEMTGMQVESPDGDVYEGFRVRTPQQEVFSLQNTQRPIVIVIYAPQPEVFPVAQRLAGNVSNGGGLADYPIYNRTLGILPAEPPRGFVLQEMTTFLPEDLGLTREQLVAEMGGDVPPEVEELITWLEQFIPERITTARYRDPSQRGFDVVSGDYGGSLRAMTTWLTLRALAGTTGMTSLDSAAGTGLWVDDGSGPIFLARSGTTLFGVGGPPGASSQELVALANSMQIVAAR